MADDIVDGVALDGEGDGVIVDMCGKHAMAQSEAEGAVEASEFLVTEQTLHRGEPLKDIRRKKNVLVAGITRGANTVIPDGASRFEVGDFVVVVAPSEAEIMELNDIFE